MNWQDQMIAEWMLQNTYWKQVRFWWWVKSTETGKKIRPLQKVWIRGLRLPGVWQKDRIDKILTKSEFEKLQLRGKIPDWQRIIK